MEYDMRYMNLDNLFKRENEREKLREKQVLAKIKHDNELKKIKDSVLDCPICNQKPTLNKKSDCVGHGGYVDEYYYVCIDCGLMNGNIKNGLMSELDVTKDAIKTWNNMVKKLREKCK